MASSEVRMIRITKGSRHDLDLFAEGIATQADLGRTLDEARQQAAADRIRLARIFVDQADRLFRARPPMDRSAISRYYYGMYHAMRAVAFHDHRGDDFENHTTLSLKGVPDDFPNAALARNDLKDARLRRNEADYEPYPSDTKHYRRGAILLEGTARAFINTAEDYLRQKGNVYL